MNKKILGLDLGTTSIGFAVVNESEDYQNSNIELMGVRVNPLTTNEITNFEEGKPITTNASRTLARSARRNLQRYKLRREVLRELLLKNQIINKDSILSEGGKNSTFETWKERSEAVSQKISLDAFARVLFAINKKRGYKSSRKVASTDEGHAIDGMAIAKKLYENDLTPGQYVYQLLKTGKNKIPEFYRSDLVIEFEKVWSFQKKYHEKILTDEFKKSIMGLGQKATSALFWKIYEINTAEIKGNRAEKFLTIYELRNNALVREISPEELASVLTAINNDLNQSSGYLGEISDRSKSLYFNNETIGEFIYKNLKIDPHYKTKGQVFYRQDYLDEFEKIWEEQSKYYNQLSNELKSEVRDVVIFYQRKLKSQKSLLNTCELNSKELNIKVDGIVKKIITGPKVIAKSSPLFQVYKIWQILGNVELRHKETKEIFKLDLDAKQFVFNELNIKGTMTSGEFLKTLGYSDKEYDLNYKKVEGNNTNQTLYNAYLKILDIEGYSDEFIKGKNEDNIDISKLSMSGVEIKKMIKEIFSLLNINSTILEFDTDIDPNDQNSFKKIEQQSSFQLWHLLYSFEDDTTTISKEDQILYGNSDISLKKKLCSKYGFKPEHSKILAQIVFPQDYGSLSSNAILRILPHLQENEYSVACELAGFKHSKKSLTKEEIENKSYTERLVLLKKNSLRNPVVEKILNQMVNVVNTIIDDQKSKLKMNDPFHFDEIRIELSRELKKNAKERAEMTSNISSATKAHENIVKILKSEFNIPNPSRKDIIRYKLYEELRNNGYKDLYTNTYIDKDKLFSKEIDVDHIIPQMTLFDDSFSNKTLCFRHVNIDKGNKTSFDYILSKYGETAVDEYKSRIEMLFNFGKKNANDGISRSKYLKLLKKESEIGEGFIERDLRESQYIAKKAKEMLEGICKSVVSTSGEITSKLRNDWGLNNLMQEINLPKYRLLGMTEVVQDKDNRTYERIIDWTKRDDHRHHAVDALVIAFTRRAYIQYLNHLNARKNEKNKFHLTIKGIESNHIDFKLNDTGSKERVFKLPFSNFRQEVLNHLENIIVSFKAKNKVVTKNKNSITTKNGTITKITLTPRGQLHKESVYSKYNYHVKKEVKIDSKLTVEIAQRISNPTIKRLILSRLQEFENDPVKAFSGKNSLKKNPIYLNNNSNEEILDKVQVVYLEEDYSIRKPINKDNFKDEKSIQKVVDKGVRDLLLKRLAFYNGDAQKAFSDLDKNPIWLNKEKGITIKSVKISGIRNAESLHFKKDHQGAEILDSNGQKIPTDYISTGNNHHVAIYEDENGNLQEVMVSFFDAVRLVNENLPIINKEHNRGIGWRFIFSLKQNEMFIFPNEETGFDPTKIDVFDPKNRKEIAQNIYRVQKIATKDYMFRHQYETRLKDSAAIRGIIFKRITSLNLLKNVIKIGINHIGQPYLVKE